MAYITQDQKKLIAANIKEVLKKYPSVKIKYTLAMNKHASTLYLNISQCNLDFISNHNETTNNQTLLRPDEFMINPYWIEYNYSGIVKDFLIDIHAALKSAGWYDKSDIQSDYFDTAYYININCGRWNKPFILLQD